MTPWTVAHQAPLSMAFSRQEHWSWLPCPPPGDLPNSGMEPRSPALQADSLPSELPGRPQGPLLVNQKGLECFHWYEVQLFLLGCPQLFLLQHPCLSPQNSPPGFGGTHTPLPGKAEGKACPVTCLSAQCPFSIPPPATLRKIILKDLEQLKGMTWSE